MIAPKFMPLVLRQLLRHRTRTALTLGGVGIAMFLFFAVLSIQRGAREATGAGASDQTLVVYRANRFCPSTSRLPEHYTARLDAMGGVSGVLPMLVTVNNCRAGMDVVTFRGVPEERFLAMHGPGLQIVDGSLAAWQSRSDAALVGQTLARRRGLNVGDRFSAAGVTAYVAGIIRSDQPQDHNVAYVHLPFLQQSAGVGSGSVVTQFNVRVADPAQMQSLARAIDQEFATDAAPTQTSPERAFVARAAADVLELVRFVGWLGWGCLAAVVGLVANAIFLSVQDRIREQAILQTLGFTGGLIARMVVVEAVLLGLAGGMAGTLLAVSVLRWGQFALSAEGLSIYMPVRPDMLAMAAALALGLGLIAGLAPAWQVWRRPIAECFRAV